MAVAEFYKAVRNSIVDSTGKQIAVVLPSNCTMKLAREMAAYAAQQANHDAQRKARAQVLRGNAGVLGTSNDQQEKRDA